MPRGLTITHPDKLEWVDDVDVLTLGKGLTVKVLHHNPETDELSVLVKFPPGYHEPAHKHHSSHSYIVLEGLQIVDGVELRPGDFVYGGYDVEHGPFDYPEGCVVFSVFKGASAHHRYPGSPGGEM